MYKDESHFEIKSHLPPNYSEMKLLRKKSFKQNKLQIPLGWSPSYSTQRDKHNTW